MSKAPFARGSMGPRSRVTNDTSASGSASGGPSAVLPAVDAAATGPSGALAAAALLSPAQYQQVLDTEVD